MTAVQLLITAAAGQPVHLTPDLARKLLSCENDGDVAACLGLSRLQRIRMRNDALVQAARDLGASGHTTWQAAQILAQAVRRFECALLPVLRAGQNPSLSPHEAALWRAYQVSGTRPLRNPRKLYSLLMLY